MMLTDDELDAGVRALLDREARGLIFGPTDQDRVQAVLDAVLPLLIERLHEQASEEGIRMITAIVMSAGGRVAVPTSVYESASGVELVRYDDPTTMSAVFETPMTSTQVA